MTPEPELNPAGEKQDLDGVDLHDPEQWQAFLLGWQWGIHYGITAGRQELADELIPAGRTLAAMRTWRYESHQELVRRRRCYPGPAFSAEQIRRRALESWTPGHA